MTKLRLAMIGSEAEQQEVATMLVDQQTMQQNRNKLVLSGTYYFIAESLKSRNSRTSRETFWLGVKEMNRLPFPNQYGRVSDYDLTDVMSGFKDDESDLQLDWLRQSGVLSGLNDFDPILNLDNKSKSVWGEVLKGVRYRFRNSKSIKELLSKKENLTFGEKLLLSYLKWSASKYLPNDWLGT